MKRTQEAALTVISEPHCTKWHQLEYGCTWRRAGLPVRQCRQERENETCVFQMPRLTLTSCLLYILTHTHVHFNTYVQWCPLSVWQVGEKGRWWWWNVTTWVFLPLWSGPMTVNKDGHVSTWSHCTKMKFKYRSYRCCHLALVMSFGTMFMHYRGPAHFCTLSLIIRIFTIIYFVLLQYYDIQHSPESWKQQRCIGTHSIHWRTQ